MACNILSHSPPFLSFHQPKPYQINANRTLKPTNPNRRTLTIANLGSAVANVETVQESDEKPKFKWTDIRPTSQQVSEEQRIEISRLPRKMAKRCKAFMRQMICYSPEIGSLSDLVSSWVRIMMPIRSDWLAVLNQLSDMDHPFYLQVFEYALNEDSFEANVRDYTKIIHLYAKQNRLQDAEATLLAMARQGLTYDQVTLTTMIHMYSKSGNFNKAEELFDEMKLLGQPLDKRSYGSMIMAYIRAGLPTKGEALVLEMERHEIYPGSEVYKALLRAYSMKGDCEGAQRVFDAIQLSGVFPDVRQCALLINAYVVAGQSVKARVAFENVRMAGVEPSDKCVALLLGMYEKENDLNAALDLVLRLEEDGIVVGKESSEVLAAWFRRLGVAKEVGVVLREYAEQ